jgi:predicted DNA-binding transcriptional regulator YafY
VLDKVRSLLPARALDYFRELDETVYVRRVGLTDYAQHAETIRILTEAARASRSVEIRYHSLWRRDEYTTRYDPYGLVFHEGDLFVVGFSHKAGAVRIFKVTRVLSAELTAEPFDRPLGFSLESHFRNTFGIVRSGGKPVEVLVRFTGPVAALVEERLWHETQKLEWLPPGSTLFEEMPEEPDALLATFRLSDFVELKRWLKGFGEHAEVLKPQSLRREMREELLAAARRYQG